MNHNIKWLNLSDINSDSVTELILQLQQAISEDKKVMLEVSSEGGCVDDSLRLFYHLKQIHVDKLIVHFSYSASAANYLLALPHHKTCYPSTTWFFHLSSSSYKRVTENTIGEMVDNHEKVTNLIWSLQKSFVTLEEVTQRKEFYLYPQDLIDRGVNITIMQ